MPRMSRLIVPGFPHHVTQRGVRSMDIFPDDDARLAYLQFLSEEAGRSGVQFLSWCLMTNHVHFIAIPNDKTAVCRGHDFVHKGVRYQIKAHLPSGKPGSFITNAGKARNYDWDVLIWIRYNTEYEIQEAWSWPRDSYITAFDAATRISPEDMRKGQKLA